MLSSLCMGHFYLILYRRKKTKAPKVQLSFPSITQTRNGVEWRLELHSLAPETSWGQTTS